MIHKETNRLTITSQYHQGRRQEYSQNAKRKQLADCTRMSRKTSSKKEAQPIVPT